MLWFLVGFFILYLISAMLLNEHGRKILGVMAAIIFGVFGLIWLGVTSNDRGSSTNGSLPLADQPNYDAASGQPSTEATQTPTDLAEAAFAEKRYVDAFSIYARMKRHGGALGLDRMAWMYDSGNGIPQNSAKAFDLYRKAAALGDSNAQLNLGVYYGNGRATPQDYLKAYVWSTIAAARGEDEAAQNRDNYGRSLSAEQLSFAQEIAEKCMKKSMALCDRDYSIPDSSATDGN